ncbi:MAG: phosphotransferase enzyme family protein, partial [Bacteroidota bacterium]
MNQTIQKMLVRFGLSSTDFAITPIGTGYIHQTFKLAGKKSYVLQRVNKNVFTKPEVIASNLRIAADYLKKNYPDYLFLSAVPTTDGNEMAYDDEGFPWRLFPYFKNTITIDKVGNPEEAHSAAAEFGKLTRYLDKIDVKQFKPTIEKFHDLSWRFEQFESALKNPAPGRIQRAEDMIDVAHSFSYLVQEYNSLIQSGALKPRITHNDTKINNVLFDSTSGNAVCAIDLDTLMPGYFIYDLGDIVRTFVSPVDEEEKDLAKVVVRKEIYQAVITGYLSQMGEMLSDAEKKAIPFSGLMMTYIMALRALTDFINGDIYYHIKYEGQNLVRAKNL